MLAPHWSLASTRETKSFQMLEKLTHKESLFFRIILPKYHARVENLRKPIENSVKNMRTDV